MSKTINLNLGVATRRSVLALNGPGHRNSSPGFRRHLHVFPCLHTLIKDNHLHLSVLLSVTLYKPADPQSGLGHHYV